MPVTDILRLHRLLIQEELVSRISAIFALFLLLHLSAIFKSFNSISWPENDQPIEALAPKCMKCWKFFCSNGSRVNVVIRIYCISWHCVYLYACTVPICDCCTWSSHLLLRVLASRPAREYVHCCACARGSTSGSCGYIKMGMNI